MSFVPNINTNQYQQSKFFSNRCNFGVLCVIIHFRNLSVQKIFTNRLSQQSYFTLRYFFSAFFLGIPYTWIIQEAPRYPFSKPLNRISNAIITRLRQGQKYCPLSLSTFLLIKVQTPLTVGWQALDSEGLLCYYISLLPKCLSGFIRSVHTCFYIYTQLLHVAQ